MNPKTLFRILEKIKANSLDIVEISADILPSNTGFTAAKIINKVIRCSL